MDRIKRNERLGAMSRILTASPNRIFTLSHFCELFGTAKSTISEDIDLLSATFDQFELGKITTVAGAAGGVVYRAAMTQRAKDELLLSLSQRLSQPGRLLPGGFLYTSDVMSDCDAAQGMGRILAERSAQERTFFSTSR